MRLLICGAKNDLSSLPLIGDLIGGRFIRIESDYLISYRLHYARGSANYLSMYEIITDALSSGKELFLSEDIVTDLPPWVVFSNRGSYCTIID